MDTDTPVAGCCMKLLSDGSHDLCPNFDNFKFQGSAISVGQDWRSPITCSIGTMPIDLPLTQFTFREIARLDSPLRWQPIITPLSTMSDSSVPRAISLSAGSTPAYSRAAQPNLLPTQSEKYSGLYLQAIHGEVSTLESLASTREDVGLTASAACALRYRSPVPERQMGGSLPARRATEMGPEVKGTLAVAKGLGENNRRVGRLRYRAHHAALDTLRHMASRVPHPSPVSPRLDLRVAAGPGFYKNANTAERCEIWRGPRRFTWCADLSTCPHLDRKRIQGVIPDARYVENNGAAPECKIWEISENGRYPRKPADQRHRPARFPLANLSGIELGSPWWEASSLTVHIPRPQEENEKQKQNRQKDVERECGVETKDPSGTIRLEGNKERYNREMANRCPTYLLPFPLPTKPTRITTPRPYSLTISRRRLKGTNRVRWRSGNSLDSHSRGPGFDSRSGHPDFCSPWLSEITPGECRDSWDDNRFLAIPSQWLEYSPLTKANLVRLPAGSPPDFHMWDSCRTIPLVGGLSRGSPDSLALAFRRCSIITSPHPHRLSRPQLFPVSILPSEIVVQSHSRTVRKSLKGVPAARTKRVAVASMSNGATFRGNHDPPDQGFCDWPLTTPLKILTAQKASKREDLIGTGLLPYRRWKEPSMDYSKVTGSVYEGLARREVLKPTAGLNRVKTEVRFSPFTAFVCARAIKIGFVSVGGNLRVRYSHASDLTCAARLKLLVSLVNQRMENGAVSPLLRVRHLGLSFSSQHLRSLNIVTPCDLTGVERRV
ncbi:hypothetical protein PR048_028945 [Dryococelus australis]|uniref:Uncharacterized protein n=1 Tax=Dryococelus australis TaxID=614101 RepID=A0ABQ9GBZ0_9NEOP|nr:hypothetical protein PR048_028945 [Dryococelus australis]